MLKSLMEVRGSFGMNASNCHTVPCSISHPYWPNKRLYFIICPSHQLKSMINAFHSSRSGGNKDFQSACGISFGWQTVLALYDREVSRMKQCVPREVPKLRKNFVIRDPWTKLNVMPAKVMQQDKVLTELADYLATSHPDNANVKASRDYLAACNLLFEKGTLSHVPVKGPDSEPLACVATGFKFFENWMSSLISSHPHFLPTSPKTKEFLSWQTWDLLRLMRFGFVDFCKDFTTRNPSHYIVPVRVTGSAIETVFSQLKHAAGGCLTAANYASSRASLQVQRSCIPSHCSNASYRDQPVHFAAVPSLLRKNKSA